MRSDPRYSIASCFETFPFPDDASLAANKPLEGIAKRLYETRAAFMIATDQGLVRLKLVKPCVRCSIPGVDPDSGEQGCAVTDTLAGYRADARMDGAVTFGMNAIVLDGVGRELAAGQRCRASYAF